MKYILLPFIKFVIKALLTIIIIPFMFMASILITIWDFKFPSFEEKYSGYELKDNFSISYFLHKEKIEKMKGDDIIHFKSNLHLIWWKPH